MSTNGLAAPGSSTYDSNTLHVGDGTWDADRDTFLLPNLMGLNFATMQYNGMRNRFRNLAEYHNLIAAHGILAAITFLFMIPFAIFMARFYHRNARLALRLHIWTQILVFFFVTVVFVLGWFAVGPQRSLTNPHHGIGLALYVMIIFNILYGSWVHSREKKKIRYKIPLRLFLHQWLGRAIALLGIVQVALGLTLYGSPKSLFILYAVWGFILLLAWFVLSYRYQNTVSVDDRGSYFSGSRTDITPETEHRHGRFGKIAAGVGAAGLVAALAKRRRSRSRSRSRTRTDFTSHHGSESYVDEKHSEHGKKNHTWRDRLLVAGGTVGAIAAVKRIFGGKRDDRTEISSVSDYSRPPPRPYGGAHSVTETDYSRIEEGNRPHTPTGHGHGHGGAAAMAALPAAAALAATGSPSRHSRHSRHSRRSHSGPGRPDVRPTAGGSIHSYSSWEESMADSPGKAKRQTHTFRDGIAALGVAGYLRHKWNQRSQAKDDRRIEEIRRQERIEEERLARHDANRRRYTGDGAPIPRPPPHRRHGSISESEISPLGGSNPELSLHSLPLTGTHQTTTDVTAANTAANAGNMLTPPPQMPATIVRIDSSGSEAYMSPGGRQHHRHRVGDVAAGAAAGAALASAGRHERNSSRRRDSDATSSVNSPQAAVQVKMHNDGRHVTLRRLDPKEREAERRRRLQRPGRTGSISSGAGASGDEHWRRVERMEQEQAAQMRADAIAAGEAPHNIPPPMASLATPPPHVPVAGGTPPSLRPGAGPPPPQPIFSPAPSSQMDLPPPPPIPAAGSGMGGSPGSIYGSGPSNVDSRAESNRRRRRAERARQEAAAREQRGNRVDFT